MEWYIGSEISKVPLSNIAQKIMTALQSIPVEAQTNRENNQSTEKTKENKLHDKDAHLRNEKEDCDFRIATLKTTVSPEKRTAGQIVRTVHMDKILGCQDTKILSCYQDSGFPEWQYQERSLSVEEKALKDGENKIVIPLKRRQNVSTSCSEKTRRLHLNTCMFLPERRHSCTPGQIKPSGKYPCDISSLGCEEKRKLLATIEEAAAFITTMIFQDGSSQLNSEQDSTSSVKGVVVLVKNQTDQPCPPGHTSTGSTWNAANENDKLIYLKTEQSSLWEQEQEQAHKKFSWQVLFQMLQCKVPIICFNAKDFLRTLLQIYGNEISWKQVANSVVLDPRIAAWLINPSDTVPSFECLIQKYFEKPFSKGAENTDTGTLRNISYQNLGVNLEKLYNVMMDLANGLKAQGLWNLFCTLELPLIKILAVMETHKIYVNKQELKKTSEILGLRLKELEQEAHEAAGERFLLTSSCQLREVLFDKLKLHTLCEKLHRTEIQQLVSTSEVVLNKLQDLHPLPKIILEYRQVHKMKSTYVDGLRTCMKKGFISSTWNQTGTVTGRLSAKHPNIQGISKHPVTITKKQYIKGKEEDIITISPRTLFVSKKGCTFLAADFSHIELRILADLSSEPELLKLFQEPEITDIFSTLASQWKGIPIEQVKHADREQAKRIVYSVVYGAGSAADLCKMAMVKIFASVVISPTLTARLIAQIHDELLFEVEDSQIQEFSALVKRIMESLQQTTALEVPLKVPLKVILTTGKSWGCMTELQEM
ncbi:DNA polymerase nu isoform X4 [Passer domesticus]|uniref:DNA polymerase nu isoform X4 n=1 Tax=Passer domesticus TaxID=48849 RepID=UPI0030FED4F1